MAFYGVNLGKLLLIKSNLYFSNRRYGTRAEYEVQASNLTKRRKWNQIPPPHFQPHGLQQN